jgi:hypothetical protein
MDERASKPIPVDPRSSSVQATAFLLMTRAVSAASPPPELDELAALREVLRHRRLGRDTHRPHPLTRFIEVPHDGDLVVGGDALANTQLEQRDRAELRGTYGSERGPVAPCCCLEVLPGRSGFGPAGSPRYAVFERP